MTSHGSNFDDFLENQLTQFRAVETINLRQIGSGTTRSFVQSNILMVVISFEMIMQYGI